MQLEAGGSCECVHSLRPPPRHRHTAAPPVPPVEPLPCLDLTGLDAGWESRASDPVALATKHPTSEDKRWPGKRGPREWDHWLLFWWLRRELQRSTLCLFSLKPVSPRFSPGSPYLSPLSPADSATAGGWTQSDTLWPPVHPPVAELDSEAHLRGTPVTAEPRQRSWGL